MKADIVFFLNTLLPPAGLEAPVNSPEDVFIDVFIDGNTDLLGDTSGAMINIF